MIIVRSALFLLWFAILSTVLSLLFCPVLILPRGATVWLARSWARATLWGLRIFAGIGMEVRGQPPAGPVLVAAKHMSMWDTLALYVVLDDPGIVLKRELLWIPFYGWFLWKATAIAIDRDAGVRALAVMGKKARRVAAEGRPILIFPEGTRKNPGAPPDYRPGVAALHGMLDIPCVPAALNSGVHWTGFLKKPGIIVLEFLEPIAPGGKRREFMKLLETRIETATNRLL